MNGVIPGTSGSSVNGVGVATVTANTCLALSPPGSVGVTRMVDAPRPTALNLARVPARRTVTTCGADDDTV
ncbi:MAG: hypothetical protein OXG35_33505 [Acidobacteria bacterium]|nr:hypothetical protein [Acidobacteriota bacterium]